MIRPTPSSTLFPYTTLFRSGVRDKLRVLLVSGEPHAGERTWRNLLKSDASVDLVHFTRSEEHTSELQSHVNLVCRLLLEKKNTATSHATETDLLVAVRYRRT